MSPIAAEKTTGQAAEIPRKIYNGKPAGPLIIPPGEKHQPGEHICEVCKRKVAPVGRRTRGKGTCKCMYYKRCTTWIDVLQSEFALKQWDRRMVSYGMSQRPDLVLAAAACDSTDLDSEKSALQTISGAAIEAAQASAAANVGTALHRLTERMDRGETLGVVPDPYPEDLRAYEECIKSEGIEWVDIESFRVHDDYKVAGTTDRIGWYHGQLRIFDLKTSPKENPISYPHGPCMQLAMYAHSTPYIYPGDYRRADPDKVDLNVAYIINMPAGKGRCEIRPIDIKKGWAACQLAAQVWTWRDTKDLILDPNRLMNTSTFIEMAQRSGSETELRGLWINARENCCLTEELRQIILARVKEVKG